METQKFQKKVIVGNFLDFFPLNYLVRKGEVISMFNESKNLIEANTQLEFPRGEQKFIVNLCLIDYSLEYIFISTILI